MNAKLAQEIQTEQDHGRLKYGGSVDNLAHDDATPNDAWHEFIENHNQRAECGLPMERRQHLVKVAGLAVSAIEAFDRNNP